MDDPEQARPLPPSNTPLSSGLQTDDGLPPVVLEPLPPPRPWGPWATLGWAALVLVVMVIIQNVVAVAFIAVRLAQEPKIAVAELVTSGNLLAVAALTSMPVVLVLVIVLVRLRRCSLRSYLALSWPSPSAILYAIAGLAIVLFLTDALTVSLGRPIVPTVMVKAYDSSWPPLMLLAVLVAAPLGEETIMRGFLFQGIAASRWGAKAAIVISALVWAAIHVQYDLYGMGTVFVTGLYLGAVRHRTGSVPLCMVLHALGNAVATVEIMVIPR